MRSRYRRFVVLYVPLSLAAACLLFMWFLYSVNTSEDLIWTRELKTKKDSHIQTETRNKIVVQSGSNALFGIRTEDIERELGIPAYNMAIHAGLGLDFMLDESKEFLKQGDILILPLEHEVLMIDFFSHHTKLAFDYYRLYEPQDLYRITLQERWKFLIQNNPIEAVVNTTTALLKNPSQIGYKSANVNDHGDQIKHVEHNEGLIRNIKPIELPTVLAETNGLKKLAEFNEWCEEHGVTLYYTYPNMLYFKEYLNPEYKNYFAFMDQYFAEHHIKVLIKAYDSFYAPELFYDTYYHLNEAGMTARTRDIIAALKQVLRIP